ncbi:unnamed protein product [Linum tenue]|uniref:EF-hand domain-containing protein n=1 Tax=Linum tenue TaxID=586396 RepID=A0AAV0R4V0_9ROSI|nr:unnamed protein product [Linum tenue]
MFEPEHRESRCQDSYVSLNHDGVEEIRAKAVHIAERSRAERSREGKITLLLSSRFIEIATSQPCPKLLGTRFSSRTRRWSRKLETASCVYGRDTKGEFFNHPPLGETAKEKTAATPAFERLVPACKARHIQQSFKTCSQLFSLGPISFVEDIFKKSPRSDVYLWNTMVSAFVRRGHFHKAVDCFHQFLLTSGVRPDFYTFPPVLKACRNLFDGMKVHCSILKLGFEWDVFVAASLIHLYSRFGVVEGACRLFHNMPYRDSGSWNAMISGYCLNGNAANALELADAMRLEGEKMDAITVASTLPACVQMNDVVGGKLMHLYAVKHGLELNLFVSNALIDMYGKFGRLGDARRVFEQMVIKDIVSWNSIIAAYEQHGEPIDARLLFDNMQQLGIQPDAFTLVSLASTVSQLSDHRSGRSLHGFLLRKGYFSDAVITGNAVVDMYAKMGTTEYARAVFEGLPIKDVVTWNSLITGYAQNGLANEASNIFHMMEESKDISPSQGTWVSILPAYSQLGALGQGMLIHARVIKDSMWSDIYVGTCLVDLYGKCGRLDDAVSLFYEVPRQSSVPWNAIISCHGVHGHGERALEFFREMLDGEVKPDHVTFVSLLSACSHSGMVSDGEWCFCLMQEKFGIKPILKHYGCMVDLYGRAGLLDVAFEFIKSMPMKPDGSIWGALISACRIHRNVELGIYASDRLFEVDSENVGYYVLLSNMYANAGKWEGVNDVRSLARGMGLKKTPGWSSIEVDKKVNVFYTGNQTHPQCNEIYKELKELCEKIKAKGYVPDFGFVLQDVEDDEKEHILMSHSESLASSSCFEALLSEVLPLTVLRCSFVGGSRSLTLEEVAGIQEPFDMMDTTGKGRINIDELNVGLHKLGQHITDSDLQIVIEAVTLASFEPEPGVAFSTLAAQVGEQTAAAYCLVNSIATKVGVATESRCKLDPKNPLIRPTRPDPKGRAGSDWIGFELEWGNGSVLGNDAMRNGSNVANDNGGLDEEGDDEGWEFKVAESKVEVLVIQMFYVSVNRRQPEQMKNRNERTFHLSELNSSCNGANFDFSGWNKSTAGVDQKAESTLIDLSSKNQDGNGWGSTENALAFNSSNDVAILDDDYSWEFKDASAAPMAEEEKSFPQDSTKRPALAGEDAGASHLDKEIQDVHSELREYSTIPEIHSGDQLPRKRYFLAVGEIYRVSEVVPSTARLYKPWILLEQTDSISFSTIMSECCSLWSGLNPGVVPGKQHDCVHILGWIQPS